MIVSRYHFLRRYGEELARVLHWGPDAVHARCMKAARRIGGIELERWNVTCGIAQALWKAEGMVSELTIERLRDLPVVTCGEE